MQERGLTKVDLAALRKCTSMVFDHHRAGTNGSAQGAIRCIKRRTLGEQEADPFGGDSVTYPIPIANSLVRVYTEGLDIEATKALREQLRGCEVLNNGHESDVCTTVGKIAKVGDIIRLEWLYDSNNGYVKKTDLHVDRLYVIIHRPGKAYKQFRFLVCVSCCEDNSARLLRRHG